MRCPPSVPLEPAGYGLELFGAGIAGRDKKHLFGRGDGKTTDLGLFLSREILLITRIAIRETGEPGHGARFEMDVPKGGYRFMQVRN